MSFGKDLKAFAAVVETRSNAAFLGSVGAVHESITEGSEITGAPGQPVDTGNLLGGWQETYPERWVGQSATAVKYAPSIEDGQQAPYVTTAHERVIKETGQIVAVRGGTQVTPGKTTFRSEVGGPHSVKLTRAGWPKLLKSVVEGIRG